MKSLNKYTTFYFSFIETKIKERNLESHVSVFIHPFHDVCNFVDQFTDINWPY